MKKILKKHWLLIVLLSIPYFLIVLSGVIRINYDMTSPGDLNKVGNVISVEGAKEEGSFNTVSVYSVEKVTLLTFCIGMLDRIVDLEESSELIQMTNQESYTSGTIQKNVSINNAIILAYNQANKKIESEYQGLIVHTVFKDFKYDIRIGDIITKYNNEEVTDAISFKNKLINDVRENNSIILTINRDGKTCDIMYEPIYTEDKKSFYIGLSFYDYYTIVDGSANPEYELNKSNTLGPSGGLMQALSVYNAITEDDLTKGRKIAGTGTIDINGDIGAIGGIYQKVFTAYFSNADVFFVPVEKDVNGDIIIEEGNNYSEALRAYEVLGKPDSMSFVPVANFKEAVEWLLENE